MMARLLDGAMPIRKLIASNATVGGDS